MASRTITTLTDDIDGSDADETITFAFKGMTYANRPVQEELSTRSSSPPALHHRRPHHRRPTLRHRPHHPPRRRQDQLAKIRDWARAAAITSPTTATSAPPSRALQRRQLKTATPGAAHPRAGWASLTVFSTSRLERYQTSASLQQRHPGQGPDAIQARCRLGFQVSLPVTRTVGRLRHLVLVGPQAVVLRGEVAGDEMVA